MSDAAPNSPSPHSPFAHGPTGPEWKTAHDAMKADDTLWTSLAFDGVQHDGRGGLIENRRCPHCGSTLSRAVSVEQAREICARQASLIVVSSASIADAEQAPPKPRGFAAMSPEQHREIAALGGKAAHQKGRAHRFTSEKARTAGRLGGQAVSADADYMAKIGQRGGKARIANLRKPPAEK